MSQNAGLVHDQRGEHVSHAKKPLQPPFG
jgi:hypothetical protein